MLKIKDGVDVNNPIVIFVPKNKGRRLTFNHSKVDEKDYPKYKLMGFNIFRCTECGTDTCYGDCQSDKNIIEEIKPTIEIIELEEDLEITLDSEPKEDVSKMKWGAFRAYCKNKGIDVTGKKRAVLEQELKDLDNGQEEEE